jgi:predicted DNA-binding transcriptional regulator AlpA
MDDLMTTNEAAERLRLAPKTLRNWRNLGEGPKSIVLPNGSVRYRVADVDAWIASGMEEESDE